METKFKLVGLNVKFWDIMVSEPFTLDEIFENRKIPSFFSMINRRDNCHFLGYMEWTSYKDRFDNEIFMWDIVKNWLTWWIHIVVRDKWWYYCFCIEDTWNVHSQRDKYCTYDLSSYLNSEAVIIWNIFEWWHDKYYEYYLELIRYWKYNFITPIIDEETFKS